MEKALLDDLDYKLIKHAHRVFETVDSDWHGVSSALRLQSGQIFTGVVLEAEVPALTVCAEGQGPRFVKMGRKVLYREIDLYDYIEGQLRVSTCQHIHKIQPYQYRNKAPVLYLYKGCYQRMIL